MRAQTKRERVENALPFCSRVALEQYLLIIGAGTTRALTLAFTTGTTLTLTLSALPELALRELEGLALHFVPLLLLAIGHNGQHVGLGLLSLGAKLFKVGTFLIAAALEGGAHPLGLLLLKRLDLLLLLVGEAQLSLDVGRGQSANALPLQRQLLQPLGLRRQQDFFNLGVFFLNPLRGLLLHLSRSLIAFFLGEILERLAIEALAAGRAGLFIDLLNLGPLIVQQLNLFAAFLNLQERHQPTAAEGAGATGAAKTKSALATSATLTLSESRCGKEKCGHQRRRHIPSFHHEVPLKIKGREEQP
jgi:hypothetical protein